ncbi:hypothetical protein BW730_04910 [Tessaracoccus aquimaris]|uniref:Uncharacterized protein n=1 Tax=Tessaracoccus aquimaris TaxID=1332264 RepID=A0A1Q2CLI8_9ACTN|nr:hypothetical protein [Tessaracoccus aquimaris]AQP46959.1 hypothetical protein BW730_04910 [Tessaracoccus aquimaris]
MSAPFHITHETVAETIQKTSDGLVRARTYDAIEAFLSFGLPVFAQHLGLAAIRAMVAADAEAAWGRAANALNRVISCHAWLAQSADSVSALGQGQEAWQGANAATEEATLAMRQVIDTYTHWDGAGAAGQLAKAKGQLMAQQELLEVTEKLQQGCAKADSVMRSVFQRVAITLAAQLMAANGLAQRAPSPTTNMFALNSRVKIYALTLESAAEMYEGIRAGDGWSGPSASLAGSFADHGGRIERVAAKAKAAMPV